MWVGGTVPPNTMNVPGFYLLLLALFILTSILNAKFLAQTISEINTKQRVLKLIVGAVRPYTAQQGVVIVRTGKCQPEAKHQSK